MEPFLAGRRQLAAGGRVNLLGVMLTLQAGARSMVGAAAAGRLLATASIAGLHGEPGSAAYCASKAAVIGLVRTLAVELAPHRITVNAVAPGQIDTAMNARDLETVGRSSGRPARSSSRAPRAARARPPARDAGGGGGPVRLPRVDDAAFITGEVIRIDGGELA